MPWGLLSVPGQTQFVNVEILNVATVESMCILIHRFQNTYFFQYSAVMYQTDGVTFIIFRTLANLQIIVTLMQNGLQPRELSFQRKLVKYIWNDLPLNNKYPKRKRKTQLQWILLLHWLLMLKMMMTFYQNSLFDHLPGQMFRDFLCFGFPFI